MRALGHEGEDHRDAARGRDGDGSAGDEMQLLPHTQLIESNRLGAAWSG